jgi:hypothetical protein
MSVQVQGFAQKTIYHSPQTPGYSAWCTLWLDTSDKLNLAFQQVTGPVAEPAKRSNVTVLLTSRDAGKTWTKDREVPARPGTGTVSNGYYASPGNSSFCGHGMCVLEDGTLITGLWAGGDRKSGYIQRSTDSGKNWSDPIYFLDPAEYKTYPTQIHRLHDGRLVMVAGVVKQADAEKQHWLLKEFFESRDNGKTWSHVWTMPKEVGCCEESDFVELDNGDLFFVHRAEHYTGDKYTTSDRLQNVFHRKDGSWDIGPVTKCPFPHSGFPQLLKTREGVVLHIATDGVNWTADAGEHWKKLPVRGSPYYPEAVQLKDGTILVAGHIGSDNVYGTVNQSIVQQTFKIKTVP